MSSHRRKVFEKKVAKLKKRLKLLLKKEKRRSDPRRPAEKGHRKRLLTRKLLKHKRERRKPRSAEDRKQKNGSLKRKNTRVRGTPENEAAAWETAFSLQGVQKSIRIIKINNNNF
jgi:hypothetical protein